MKNDPNSIRSHRQNRRRSLYILPVICIMLSVGIFGFAVVNRASARVSFIDEIGTFVGLTSPHLQVSDAVIDEDRHLSPKLSDDEQSNPLVPDASWNPTGSLGNARNDNTATLLPNGKVLVVGGQGNSGINLSSAELYDPATGTWAATGSLIAARKIHTATLLANGKVLIAGGIGGTGNNAQSSAELYDPAAGTWSATGSLANARFWHTATLLPNDKVLVAGGQGNGTNLGSAELYDPANGTWSFTGSLTLAAARFSHTATLLPNGKVLAAGGQNGGGILSSAELYDPTSGTWAVTGNLATAREFHTATLLPSGKVLVAGGRNSGFAYTNSSELYDPVAGTWSGTGSLATARELHTATLLPNGKVLVAGGVGDGGGQSSAELYDPVVGTWAATASLITARYSYTATLLPNNKVLVAGGGSNSGFLNSSELYDTATPTPTPTPSPTPTPAACTMNPVVANNGDTGPGSLRQAVIGACSESAITFANGISLITLTSQIIIDKNLSITGPGANLLTLTDTVSRAFMVNTGVAATISGLTIANSGVGDGSTNGAFGGGILNFGRLNVVSCTLSGNGAISNSGTSAGGGISNGGVLNVVNSTISGNRAGNGGGISNGGTLNVANTTISGNTANTNDRPASTGGGINSSGTINITNSTISGNAAIGVFDARGGGISSTVTVNVRNTIIAGNSVTAGLFPGAPDANGTYNSQGYNLIGKNDGSTGFPAGNPNANFDMVGTTASPVNPLLGPLAGNGGPTQTLALLAGSPAIDKGAPATNPITGASIITDQRSLPRPINDPSIPPAGTAGNDSDIGAYEVQGQTPTPTPTPIPGAGFEGDINRAAVGSPGTGDGDVNVGDQIQYQRFLRGVDCPSVAPNEQRRLDAGPRSSLGDGFLGSSDGAAIDAYARRDPAVDFDPNTAGFQLTPVGGPVNITNLGCTPISVPEGAVAAAAVAGAGEEAAALTVRLISGGSVTRSGDITVEIEMAAQGNEAGTQYTLHFDPSVVSVSNISGVNANPDVSLGTDSPAGTVLNANAEGAANGTIGIVENFNGTSDSITAIGVGARRIARVTFHVRSGAAAGESKVTFDDSVVKGLSADTNGLILGTTFDQNGRITIPATAGVTVSGRVTTADGRGVRNATVMIVDPNGFTRTVTTSSFGYYTFDGLAAGARYTISVASRQYRFASRTIELTDSFTDVDFTGLE